MLSQFSMRRRRFGVVTLTLAVTTLLGIGGALPAHAVNTCAMNTSTVPPTFEIVLEDVNASYTTAFSSSGVSDVDLNLVPFNCGFTSVTVTSADLAIFSVYGSTDQKVTLENVGIFAGVIDVRLNYGSDDWLVLRGGPGADTLSVTRALLTRVEVLSLEGAGGNDTLQGGAVPANLFGGEGDDVLTGGVDLDLLEGGPGADTMDCGGGSSDSLSYQMASAAVVATLNGTGSGGEALGDTSVGCEILYGSDHIDTLKGTAAADRIFGGAGGDTITGGRGTDHLYGEGGGDVLNGNGGGDFLFGGNDNDSLEYGGGIDVFNGDAGTNSCEGYTGSTTGSKKYGRVTYYTCSI